eukprot:6533616-Prymnesium_polylepis.1
MRSASPTSASSTSVMASSSTNLYTPRQHATYARGASAAAGTWMVVANSSHMAAPGAALRPPEPAPLALMPPAAP